MGVSASTAGDAPFVGGSEAFHVLRVQEGSPGAKAGLQAYFDYIVSVEQTRLSQDDDALRQAMAAYEDRPVRLTVYSSKARACRFATVTPNSVWGGQGLLGVSVRFCSFGGAHERVWHVLDAQPSSPAALAGLQSDSDYIVGAERVLHEESDFYNLVESCDGRAMKLYVYSSVTDSCREVQLSPNSNWGGDGLLGCRIGYGYLHRIPDPGPAAVLPVPAQQRVVRTPSQTRHYPAATTVDSRGFVEVPLDSPQVSSLPPPVHGQAAQLSLTTAQQQQQHQTMPSTALSNGDMRGPHAVHNNAAAGNVSGSSRSSASSTADAGHHSHDEPAIPGRYQVAQLHNNTHPHHQQQQVHTQHQPPHASLPVEQPHVPQAQHQSLAQQQQNQLHLAQQQQQQHYQQLQQQQQQQHVASGQFAPQSLPHAVPLAHDHGTHHGTAHTPAVGSSAPTTATIPSTSPLPAQQITATPAVSAPAVTSSPASAAVMAI